MEEYSIEQYLTILSQHFLSYVFKQSGNLHIGKGQFFVFEAIFSHEGICQEGVKKITQADKITVSKAVKKLIEEGYVKKKKDEKDKRYHRLYLTGKGKDAAVQTRGVIQNFTDRLLEGYSPDGRDRIKKNLARMVFNVSAPDV